MNILDVATECGAVITPTVKSHLGFPQVTCFRTEAELAAFAQRIREDCAQKCEGERLGTNKNDSQADRWYDMACNDCAAAIRSSPKEAEPRGVM